MKPYFDTNHAAGFLILVALLAWGTMELAQRSQQQERKGAIRIGRRGFWLAAVLCVIIATNVVLYAAPRIVPAAAIHPGAVAFAAGLAILVAGIALRGWSFKALGEYFTRTAMVSPDQPVVTAGRIACCAIPAMPESCWPARASAWRPRTGSASQAWRCYRWRSSCGASTSRRTRC